MATETLDEETGTMDDTIRDTFRDLTERMDAENEPAAEAEPAKETKSERIRDETGKFAKQNSAATETPSQSTIPDEGTPPQAAEPEQALTTTSGQPIDINRAPSAWKPAAKAAWAALPEQVRAEVYRREADFMHGNKGLKENADFGQVIKSTLEPYRMLIEAEGGTPERAIADTMRTAALFRVGTPQQKLQAMIGLDRQFNCGLVAAVRQQVAAEMNGGQPQQFQQQPQFQDPRIDQIMQSMQAQERAKAQQEEAVSNAATERFISAKDTAGHPMYPFVDNVLDDMTGRVQQIRRANPSMPHEEVLKQAYEAAVWANPETRAVLIGQQQAQQQTSTEQLRKTEAAKRASRTNLPRRGSLPAGEATGTMDDTIRDTYRQLTG